MLVDSHAHLNEYPEESIAALFERDNVGLTVISNSTDLESSLRNIDLSKKYRSIIPFVGIHPEILSRNQGAAMDKPAIDSIIERLGKLMPDSSGIGEIGLDPKYGSEIIQDYLFEKMLSLSQSTSLPITIHSRDRVSKILDILSTYSVRGRILFHWFSGSDAELRLLNEKGMFTSYSPSVLFSKRLSRLLEQSRSDLILSETDSPTSFISLKSGEGSPLLISSVVFKMSLVLKTPFDSMREKLKENAIVYLGTQNSLRVKGN
jgi:TatD DNase family protein